MWRAKARRYTNIRAAATLNQTLWLHKDLRGAKRTGEAAGYIIQTLWRAKARRYTKIRYTNRRESCGRAQHGRRTVSSRACGAGRGRRARAWR